ncbi:hypothetical protein Tco_0253012 [Tanacetum coccineum]
MVAYMEKSTENVDFDEIVDFLNANPIRYALTVSPTIYVSYIEQFWSTEKIKTINNERQIRAKVNGKTIVISESSVMRDLQFNDEDGAVTPLFATMLIQSQVDVGEGSGQPTEPQHTPTTASPSHVEQIPNVASSSQPQNTHRPRKAKRPTEISQSSGPTTFVVDETVHEERRESVERAATTAASLDAEQDSGNIIRTQSTAILNEPIPYGTGSVNTLGSGEDIMKLNELMEICTRLSERVLALENIKTAQDLEIINLKKRVKKLEKKKKARTPQLKRGYSKDPGEYGVMMQETQEEDISCVPITSASPTRPVDDSITDDITLAETLMKIKISASRPKKAKGVVVKEPSEPTTTSRPQPQISAKDKGKGIMQEPEKPVKLKGKDQIAFDEEVARRLEAQMHAVLEEEERVTRQKEEEANLISWDNTQAMMEADYELA